MHRGTFKIPAYVIATLSYGVSPAPTDSVQMQYAKLNITIEDIIQEAYQSLEITFDKRFH